MKKKRLITVMVTVGMVLGLAGCGGSSNSTMNDMAMSQASEGTYSMSTGGFDSAAAEMAEMDMLDSGAEGSVVDSAAFSNRKLIRTVNMDVETKEFDNLLSAIRTQVKTLEGYIESMNTYNGSTYYGYSGTRNANMTIRIPAAQLDDFLNTISGIGNVIRRSENEDDITLTYVDLESHKAALLAEQTSLLELLEKAETVEDIITLQSRLSDIRYQLESMESQLRTMDNRISYSTVWLYISEVERYTPPEETGTWYRIRIGFSENVYRVGRGLIEFLIGFIISLPILVLIAVVIVVAVLILKLVIHLAEKNNKRKKGKKAGQTSEPMINPPAAAPTETKDTDKSDEEKQ